MTRGPEAAGTGHCITYPGFTNIIDCYPLFESGSNKEREQ